MLSSTLAKVVGVTLDDETICSSRVIILTIQEMSKNETKRIALVREALPLPVSDFDALWQNIQSTGETNFVGETLIVDTHETKIGNYMTIELI